MCFPPPKHCTQGEATYVICEENLYTCQTMPVYACVGEGKKFPACPPCLPSIPCQPACNMPPPCLHKLKTIKRKPGGNRGQWKGIGRGLTFPPLTCSFSLRNPDHLSLCIYLCLSFTFIYFPLFPFISYFIFILFGIWDSCGWVCCLLLPPHCLALMPCPHRPVGLGLVFLALCTYTSCVPLCQHLCLPHFCPFSCPSPCLAHTFPALFTPHTMCTHPLCTPTLYLPSPFPRFHQAFWTILMC